MPAPPQIPLTTAEAAASAPVPRLLGGRYRLEERLGEGELGVVWRARHLDLQRDFALKLLRTAVPQDAGALARFQREAEALGRLRHPHVVEVTDFGVDAETGLPYLVMELLPGRTLADLLNEAGPLSVARALPLLAALAAAIDAAHAQGILHRDLKPGNVALTTDSEGEPFVKVLDFGLAAIAGLESIEAAPASDPVEAGAGGERLTATGALLGTPLYAAPEVIRDGVSSRASDLYSLGVIAYEMLAGRPPFQGSTAQVLAGHLLQEPPQPAAPPLEPEVWEALRQPLGKDPGRRPATAEELVRRLCDAAERASARAARVRWRQAELPRRAALATAMAAVALAAGLLLPTAGVPPLERWLDDLRLQAVPARPFDPRLLLVTLDESSLGDRSAPLADRADELGGALAALFAAGARGVAVDLLLPSQWQRSTTFADAVLRHPDALTLAAFSAPDGRVVGTDCLSGLTAAALGPDRTSALFGFVNLDEDPDGITRTGRLLFRDRAGGAHPSWAAMAAAMLGALPRLPAGTTFRIDHRIDGRLYARLSWRDLPVALAKRPQLFRGRLILVGGDFLDSGDDYHRAPARPGRTDAVSGLTLQALQVDTLASGLPLREAPRAPSLFLAVLLTGGATLWILLTRRPGLAVVGLATAALLYAAVSLLVFRQTSLLLPVTAPCLVTALGLTTALALRRTLPRLP